MSRLTSYPTRGRFAKNRKMLPWFREMLHIEGTAEIIPGPSEDLVFEEFNAEPLTDIWQEGSIPLVCVWSSFV